MTPQRDYDHDLDDVAHRMEAKRPVPRAAFRGQLRRHLLAGFAARQSAPTRLKLLIGVYAGSGSALLAVAAAGVAGIGPLGA